MALRARVQCRPEFTPRGGISGYGSAILAKKKGFDAPVVPVSQRGGSGTGQNADRFAANRFEAGVVKVTSEFKSSDLSVGLHAVDYYVYRLRRLII